MFCSQKLQEVTNTTSNRQTNLEDLDLPIGQWIKMDHVNPVDASPRFWVIGGSILDAAEVYDPP